MPQDNTNTNDGIGLGVTGAVVATDLVSIDGNTTTHVQYVKLGWGATGDQFYAVGTDTGTIATSKPLPIMIRHTDGTAVNAGNNKLDINLAGHGITLHADISHRSDAGALYVQGTAGATPIHVMGASASEPVIIQATGGTYSSTNPQYTLPTMLFGLSGGNSAAPVGVTKDRLLVNHPDNVTIISDGSQTYVQATGGFTLSRLNPLNTLPAVLFGVTHGGGIAPLGVTGRGASGGRLLVDLDGETIPVSLVLGGSAGIDGTDTMPTYLYGESGPSAAPIGISGPHNKHRLLVDLAGERVALDADAASTHSGIFVRGTGGFTGSTAEASSILRTQPTILFGVTAAGGIEPIQSSNGHLKVEVGAATCITFDVSVNPNVGVWAATADGGLHNRYVQMSGVTSTAFKHEELHPVFVTGKADGSTYSYPVGITTSMVGASGGAWQLHVTADNIAVTKFTPTVTVQATALNIRRLTGTGALGAKDLVEVVGGSGDGPVFIRATGGLGHKNIPVHNTIPSIIYGVTGAAGASGGESAGAVGITGADMLHVGIGHPVAIDASKTNPLRTQATGGLSAGSGNNARLPLTVTVPSLVLGLSAGSDTRGAPVGMSADAIKVYDIHGRSAGRDTVSVFGGVDASHGAGDAGGTYNIPWVPTLLMGCSGASAAGVGMSGDAINVNMVNAGITVDVTIGTSIEVSNDSGGPLYIGGASGASGAEGLLPVTVAGDFLGNALNCGGSAGMIPFEVRGFSGAARDIGIIPVGVSSGNNWRMASDANLDSLGLTLDKTFKMFIAALGGDVNDDDIGANQFASKAQMDAMSPNADASTNRIANAADMSAAKGFLETIAGSVTSEPGQDVENGKQLQVDIIDVLQPSGFTSGQQALVNGSATRIQTIANAAQGFTLESGIKLKGHQDNTNFVYVGGADVNSERGFPLGPSEEIFLEIDNLSKLYAISSTSSGQLICYIGS